MTLSPAFSIPRAFKPAPFFLLTWVFFLGQQRFGSTSSIKPGQDLFLSARCHSSCSETKHSERRECVKKCEDDDWNKPGDCLKNASPLALGCVKECFSDSGCPGMLKCCPHTCGITCQTPSGLETVQDLPKVPEDVKVDVWNSIDSSVTITWKHNNVPKEYYIVEERHHSGPYFKESWMGEWNTLHKSPRLKPPIKAVFRLGTWYQVRVAAVNLNGSKGFSQPSKPFKISKPPRKPEPPQNLRVSSGTYRNGSVSVLFSWDPPQSDLPISKYIVYWSRRIATLETPLLEGSAFVQHKSVSHEKTNIRLKKLLPNVLYFLQVEAQSHYGKEHLISEKVGKVLNTSSVTPQVTGKIDKIDKTLKSKGIPYKKYKVTVVDNELSTRISWKPRRNMNYLITWESTCGSHFLKSVEVQGSSFIIKGLQFNCKYNVFLREKLNGKKGRRSSKFVITVPPCTQFTPPLC